jgi:hypothetical protein
MANWWVAVGPPEHWQIAFNQGNIWGLTTSARNRTLWTGISDGDHILFYATTPVSGVIGHGIIKTKFKQDKPLWPQEVKEGKVIWFYRFEFDVTYCLPKEKWETDKAVCKGLLPRRGFHLLRQEFADEIVKSLTPAIIEPEKLEGKKGKIPIHDEIKAKLLQIGSLQKMISESEYDMNGGKLDVVWRRVDKGSPTYVFEIQVGGDLYHAIGKLKHAHDLWNSNIFLVVTENDIPKAHQLLSGTFHEIQKEIRVIEIEKIDQLLKLKKAYKDYESQLGIS